jgi:N-methylhydantoinase B
MTVEGEIDPILAVILGKKIEAIAKEMALVLERTARSPLFQVRDFCTVLLDEKARILSQEEGLPQLAYAVIYSLRHLMDFFCDDIHDGDVFIQNDPYYGGNQAQDTCIFVPIFVDGELHFWAAAKGHLADLGSAVLGGYNPAATDIWQENFRIPPLRLYSKGEVRTDVWNLLKANTRLPNYVLGDIQASIGSCQTAKVRLSALLETHDLLTLTRHLEFLLDATEERMRAEIAQIPEGTYRSEVVYRCDEGGDPRELTARLAVTVADGRMHLDFAGSSPQDRHYYNCAYGSTFSAVMAVVLMLVDPDIPHNDGVLRCVEVTAPEGSFLNCAFPAPCVQGNFTSSDVAGDSIFRALADAAPDRVCAGWSRGESHNIRGVDPRNGEIFFDPPLLSNKGGAGGTDSNDGWSYIGLIACGGGYAAQDYELFEISNPVRVLHHEYWTDSAGPGEYRGGLGIQFRYVLLADETDVTVYGEDAHLPFGLFGGMQANRNEYRCVRPGAAPTRLPPNVAYTFPSGTEIQADNSGGGGYGPSWRRAVESVRKDVVAGFVSIDKARDAYDVIIDTVSHEVDKDATEARRAERIPI